MPLPRRLVPHGEPNRRQEIAMERIELAVSELATVVMSCCQSQEARERAITEIRSAVAPVIARVLSEE